VRPGFEGGQTPVYLRLPKRGGGFIPKKNIYRLINLKRLEEDENIASGQTLDFATGKSPVKILGKENLTKKLIIIAAAFSRSAQEKIAQAGGQTKVVSKHEK
jgi:large subunit ribosomal protein L15